MLPLRGFSFSYAFTTLYKKLQTLKVEEITDWGRLEQIKTIVDKLLRYKNE